jgi:predicted nuclease of predicted toxin-antitoxin system
MRFLLDQSAPARLSQFLGSRGHDVTRIGPDHPHGLPDHEVLAIANREQRVRITNDRDFGELVFVQRQPHHGVIYFRLSTNVLSSYTARLNTVLHDHDAELDAFLTVTDNSVRVRR